MLRHDGAVVPLGREHLLARDPAEVVEVVGRPREVPRVDAQSTVRAVGVLDDAQRGTSIGDVRHARHPFESDEKTVVGGAVAERGEPSGGIVERPIGVADHLHVATLPSVGHLVGQGLTALKPLVVIRRRPATERLDVGHPEAGERQRLVHPLELGRPLAECGPRADVQTDRLVARCGGRMDARHDVVVARAAEVVPHEIARPELSGRSTCRRHTHARSLVHSRALTVGRSTTRRESSAVSRIAVADHDGGGAVALRPAHRSVTGW